MSAQVAVFQTRWSWICESKAQTTLTFCGKFLWLVDLTIRRPVEVTCTVVHVKLRFLFFLQAHVDDRDYYGNKRLELAGQVRKILWYGTVVVAAVF